MNIPYGTQSVSKEDIEAVAETLRSPYLTTGPKIAGFEKKVADFTGAKYAVAIANGTAALHAACFAAGLEEGDEVITTPMTFAASANCALYCKAKPVFADIDEKTSNISPERIEEKITKKTKAILPVDYTGLPCDYDAILDLAKKHNLIVIEDAAHALGAVYHGKNVGTIADMTTLSFHPVKPITTGEGGMILTDNDEFYRRLNLFRTHGITRDADMLEQNEGGWYYEQLALGYNYRISDIQCALGISQMDRLPQFLEKRRQIAQRYDRAFKGESGLTLPYQPDGVFSGQHLYVIRVLNGRRKEVFDRMRAAGIGVNVHYIPVYHHPYYRKNGYADTACPNAEKHYQECLSLPIYPSLTEKQQQFVIDTLLDILHTDGQTA